MGARPHLADASGHANADTIKPGAQRRFKADGTGSLDEHEKGCLERVVDIDGVMQYPAADAQDHGTMTGDQGHKRQLASRLAPRSKPLEQLMIGQSAGHTVAQQAVEFRSRSTQRRPHHRVIPVGRWRCLHEIDAAKPPKQSLNFPESSNLRPGPRWRIVIGPDTFATQGGFKARSSVARATSRAVSFRRSAGSGRGAAAC
jgi:hypothetical protein